MIEKEVPHNIGNFLFYKCKVAKCLILQSSRFVWCDQSFYQYILQRKFDCLKWLEPDQ